MKNKEKLCNGENIMREEIQKMYKNIDEIPEKKSHACLLAVCIFSVVGVLGISIGVYIYSLR